MSLFPSLPHVSVGIRKSTRFVEGPGGKGCVHPAQVIGLHKRGEEELVLFMW